MEHELIKTKSNHWVPIVDGVVLHSTVDPVKEAKKFIDKNWDRLKGVHSVVVFGLGGGFHIEELLNRGKFQIVAIEFDRELANIVCKKNPKILEKCDLILEPSAESICNHPDIQKLFKKSFSFLEYTPSLRQNPKGYHSILDALCTRKVDQLISLTKENPGLQNLLYNWRSENPDQEFSIKSRNSKVKSTYEDVLLRALGELLA